MKKTTIFMSILSIFTLLSIFGVDAIKIAKNNDTIDFSMTVEKKSVGWHITTTLINNGDWIYVEKDGYGDIGCIIYDEEDNKIWWTYAPEQGGTWQIGTGAKYESFTIWTGSDMERNKVEAGTYKIVGASGYFEGDTYIPLTTDPYTIEVKSKETPIFYNLILNRLLNWFQIK
jgi:hypothetical protein